MQNVNNEINVSKPELKVSGYRSLQFYESMYNFILLLDLEQMYLRRIYTALDIPY